MRGRNGAATETLKEALDRLVAEEWQATVERAERFLGSAHDAEEAVQEATRNAVLAVGSLRDPGKLRTWYLRMVWTECVDLRKRRRRAARRRVPLPEDPRPEPDFESGECGEEDERAWAAVAEAPGPYYPDDTSAFIRGQVAALPEEVREPIEQVYFGGLSLVEFAKKARLPVSTAARRVEKGLALLKPRLARMRRDLER